MNAHLSNDMIHNHLGNLSSPKIGPAQIKNKIISTYYGKNILQYLGQLFPLSPTNIVYQGGDFPCRVFNIHQTSLLFIQ